jgi:hypothetical protein
VNINGLVVVVQDMDLLELLELVVVESQALLHQIHKILFLVKVEQVVVEVELAILEQDQVVQELL